MEGKGTFGQYIDNGYYHSPHISIIFSGWMSCDRGFDA